MVKGKAVADEIIRLTGNKDIRPMLVDLSSQTSIRQFARKYKETGLPLHVLINNAATTTEHKERSVDGIELMFATNVLGYFLLTNELLDVLRSTGDTRIVNIASEYAGDVDLSDVEFTRRRFNVQNAYRQSKACNRLLTYAFARRLENTNTTVNCCHPGVLQTNLLYNLGLNVADPPANGAVTPVYLATSAEVSGISGKFFVKKKLKSCLYENLIEDQEALFRLAEHMTQPPNGSSTENV
eukprot:GILJ01009938.1.p1 GENE.GILJ01009938.1~~GILJ01009938.1.p1  ORF type:complete len:240 (-),score=45.13 GILJ01009938.1:176-895(-)